MVIKAVKPIEPIRALKSPAKRIQLFYLCDINNKQQIVNNASKSQIHDGSE